MMSVRTTVASLLLAAGIALGACGGEPQDTVASARGTVRAVDPARAQVTIRHGDVPGMMRAMTMTFEVADPALLEGVGAGDEVDFDLRYAEGVYTVTALARR